MPISAADLETAIRRAMPVLHLEIEDTSNGCGENYEVFVVSSVSIPKIHLGTGYSHEHFGARRSRERTRSRDTGSVSIAHRATRRI